MISPKHLLQSAARQSRRLHVWISLFALVLVCHFALTGFVMRHPDWFGLGALVRTDVSAALPAAFPPQPDRLDVIEALRREPGLRGAVASYEPDASDGTVRVVFERPGERADVTVEPRPGGAVTGTRECDGLAGRFTALHTGDRAGTGWGLVIDGGAIALLLVALTGLSIAATHPKMRRQALILSGLGAALLLVAWLCAVP